MSIQRVAALRAAFSFARCLILLSPCAIITPSTAVTVRISTRRSQKANIRTGEIASPDRGVGRPVLPVDPLDSIPEIVLLKMLLKSRIIKQDISYPFLILSI